MASYYKHRLSAFYGTINESGEHFAKKIKQREDI